MGLESIGAGLSHRASKKAASAQKEAAAEASQTARDISAEQLKLYDKIYEEQKAQQAPYLAQGQAAINRLGDLMRNQTPAYGAGSGVNATIPMGMGGVAIIGDGGTRKPTPNANGGQLNNPFDTYLASKGLAGGKFDTSNPAYQFQLKQGQQALDRSAAARGMGYSGAQMKAAQQFGQGLASQQYDKEYDRASQEFGNYYNRLAALAQGGQQAAQTSSQLGSQYGQNVGGTLGSLSTQLQNNIGQYGNARASGYMGQANAITGGLQGITDNLFRGAGLLMGGR